MKRDKYCYEIINCSTFPDDFGGQKISQLQLKIKQMFDQEKMLRRTARQRALVDLQSTLTNEFHKKVKKEQKKEKKKEKTLLLGRHKNLKEVHKELRKKVTQGKVTMHDSQGDIHDTKDFTFQSPPDPATQTGQLFDKKVFPPIREKLYKTLGVMPSVSHKHYDPIIEKFEKQYDNARPDISKLKANLKQLLKDVRHYICSDSNTMQIALLNEDYEDVVIAVVYFGDNRFALKQAGSTGGNLPARPIEAGVHQGR